MIKMITFQQQTLHPCSPSTQPTWISNLHIASWGSSLIFLHSKKAAPKSFVLRVSFRHYPTRWRNSFHRIRKSNVDPLDWCAATGLPSRGFSPSDSAISRPGGKSADCSSPAKRPTWPIDRPPSLPWVPGDRDRANHSSDWLRVNLEICSNDLGAIEGDKMEGIRVLQPSRVPWVCRSHPTVAVVGLPPNRRSLGLIFVSPSPSDGNLIGTKGIPINTSKGLREFNDVDEHTTKQHAPLSLSRLATVRRTCGQENKFSRLWLVAEGSANTKWRTHPV